VTADTSVDGDSRHHVGTTSASDAMRDA